MSATVTATAWAVHLPGIDVGPRVTEALGRSGPWSIGDAAAPDEASTVLGRKGLLATEPATRLALCAVHRALGLAPGERRTGPVDPRTAVVATGTLGSVAAVSRIAATVSEEGGRGVSVLDAPNASPNVVATTVALRFGCGGPALQVSSGPGSGFDGLRLAELVLRSGRADRVLLVGAEPDDEVATALHAHDGGSAPLRAGAAALVLVRGTTGSGAHLVTAPAPATSGGARARHLRTAAGTLDLRRAWGDHRGAHGVVALALAAHLAVDDDHGPVTVDDLAGTRHRGRRVTVVAAREAA